MRPVRQDPETPECFRCCLASIFEVPLERMPFFGADLMGPEGEVPETEFAVTQERELQDWLEKRGVGFKRIHLVEEGDAPQRVPWGTCIAEGPGPRGVYHAVVWQVPGVIDLGAPRPGRYGEVVHDPHPSGGGLLEVESWVCFQLVEPPVFAAWARQKPGKPAVVM